VWLNLQYHPFTALSPMLIRTPGAPSPSLKIIESSLRICCPLIVPPTACQPTFFVANDDGILSQALPKAKPQPTAYPRPSSFPQLNFHLKQSFFQHFSPAFVADYEDVLFSPLLTPHTFSVPIVESLRSSVLRFLRAVGRVEESCPRQTPPRKGHRAMYGLFHYPPPRLLSAI